MISLTLNGEDIQLEDNTNIEQLLQNLSLKNKRLAVEINQQIVSRSDFNTHVLQDQDKVEIVQAIGGGSID
ncbi:MAG: sulfur carrier protein ThiS [Gammaproteobacteria bacterium]|nr:sulfur carrier protein ThiS [Gammaproteobacteria bacterium]